jgi:UDP-N-acetylmuramyl tripeptide synthase
VNGIMTVLAVWVGKLVLLALRAAGRRGNALPGLVVERLFPRFLPRILGTLSEGVVVVTGTNGKTTTTKMVATVLGERYRVLTNDTGSNFVRGVLTATVEHASWSGALPYDVAVFELDEAWAVRYVRLAPPRRALLLNVLRDQLDRFGEIDTTARLLGRVAEATTGQLVLNRDDERVAALAADTRAVVSYFGVAPALRARFPTDEELYGGPVRVADQPASAVLEQLPDGPTDPTLLRIGPDECAVPLRAGGAHNAQNAAAAAALALTFGLPPAQVAAGLARVEPAFGRGQRFEFDGRTIALHLVKNPAGFRQSLHALDRPAAATVIAINDDYADGRDVSWLWDVDFIGLQGRAGRLSTAGTRAADMAVRLRYDEVPVAEVEPDLVRAVRSAVAAAPVGADVVVFSTYTAMWAIHSHFAPGPAAVRARAPGDPGGRT